MLSYCPRCYADRTVISEALNKTGDLRTLQFDCGHSVTIAVIQDFSRIDSSDLKKRRYNLKRSLKLSYISKAYRESGSKTLVLIEAELVQRGELKPLAVEGA